MRLPRTEANMNNYSKVDLILAFAIACIAVTLTLVVAFATPTEPYEMHSTHQIPFTREPSQ
jgi:hypothetical protein